MSGSHWTDHAVVRPRKRLFSGHLIAFVVVRGPSRGRLLCASRAPFSNQLVKGRGGGGRGVRARHLPPAPAPRLRGSGRVSDAALSPAGGFALRGSERERGEVGASGCGPVLKSKMRRVGSGRSRAVSGEGRPASGSGISPPHGSGVWSWA